MKARSAIFVFHLLTMVIATCLAVAPPARAEGIYLQVHGGFSTLNLDDVNDAVDAINDAAGAQYLDNLTTGWEAGFTVGYDITRNLGLGVGYARITASSEYSRDGGLIAFDRPADLFEITLDYLPDDGRSVRVGAGADVGMVSSAAALRYSDPVVFEEEEDSFDGLGFLFAGYAIVDAGLSDQWSIYGQGGFRHAIIGEVKVDGDTVYNPDSLDDKLRLNYSGVFLRVGMKFRP